MKEIIIEVPDRFGKTLKPEKVNSEIKGELVRCKDCRKKDKEECPMYVDYPCTNKPGDDWFCAEGEREKKTERRKKDGVQGEGSGGDH